MEARLFPENTTDGELVWKVVNAAGIDIGFAAVAPVLKVGEAGDRRRAKVTAFGDGDFYVRCEACSDGKVRLISQLEACAQGLGKSLTDPYRFVSAGLCSGTIGDVTNGNEKGIATARDGESGVIFENLDFGEFGSDEVTLPVFALSDDDHEIELWLGRAHEEGSRLLDTLHYQKPSRWNEYQEETYRLPERLKGIVTISFVMRAKVHLKGFSFRRLNKAFETLSGADADRVYGDSFRIEGKAVLGIGNNVTLEYGGMDFGEEGAGRVEICGFTALRTNTIHLLFTGEDGVTHNRIVEFQGEEDKGINMQTFSFEPFTGKGKLEVLFLPGSSFDFVSIRFL